jgi:hypothetical protein
MKYSLFSILVSMILTNKNCSGNVAKDECFKGRLEIKGICSNYTISVIEGKIDTSLTLATWVDEQTGKSYRNVFALDNSCSFPTEIAAGEEFYFTIKKDRDKDCNVCMAYYPVPEKRLTITASKTPCR